MTAHLDAEQARVARHDRLLLRRVEQHDDAEDAPDDQLVRAVHLRCLRLAQLLLRVAARSLAHGAALAREHAAVGEAAERHHVVGGVPRRQHLTTHSLEREPQPQRVVAAQHAKQVVAQADLRAKACMLGIHVGAASRGRRRGWVRCRQNTSAARLSGSRIASTFFSTFCSICRMTGLSAGPWSSRAMRRRRSASCRVCSRSHSADICRSSAPSSSPGS